MSHRYEPWDFIDVPELPKRCGHEKPPCDAPATFIVYDGDCPALTCLGHLTATIEEAAESSSLTAFDGPLKVYTLRKDAP